MGACETNEVARAGYSVEGSVQAVRSVLVSWFIRESRTLYNGCRSGGATSLL